MRHMAAPRSVLARSLIMVFHVIVAIIDNRNNAAVTRTCSSLNENGFVDLVSVLFESP